MFLYNLDLNSLHVPAIYVFQNSLTAAASASKRSNCQTAPHLEIDIDVVVPVSYGCSTLNGEPGLTVWILLEIFFGIKHSIPFHK